jgi:hypothetical protein
MPPQHHIVITLNPFDNGVEYPVLSEEEADDRSELINDHLDTIIEQIQEAAEGLKIQTDIFLNTDDDFPQSLNAQLVIQATTNVSHTSIGKVLNDFTDNILLVLSHNELSLE